MNQRRTIPGSLSRAATLFFFGLALFPQWAEADEPLYIKVKSAKVRAVAQPLGTVIATLRYGDSVEQIGEEGSWLKIRRGRTTGYVHESATTDSRVVLSGAAGPQSGGSGGADVVIAGKGFNKEVEKKYASQQRGLNFAAVDQMERRDISEKDLTAFAKEGGLRVGG